MFKYRPIVVDESGMVLGGNKRLICLKKLGFKEIPDEWVKKASDLTEEEQRRFIIADNQGFGEWDLDILQENWNLEELSDWGVKAVDWSAGIEANSMTDQDVESELDQEFDPVGESKGLQRVVFIFDSEEEAKTFMRTNHKDLEFKKYNGAWHVNLSENYGK